MRTFIVLIAIAFSLIFSSCSDSKKSYVAPRFSVIEVQTPHGFYQKAGAKDTIIGSRFSRNADGTWRKGFPYSIRLDNYVAAPATFDYILPSGKVVVDSSALAKELNQVEALNRPTWWSWIWNTLVPVLLTCLLGLLALIIIVSFFVAILSPVHWTRFRESYFHHNGITIHNHPSPAAPVVPVTPVIGQNPFSDAVMLAAIEAGCSIANGVIVARGGDYQVSLTGGTPPPPISVTSHTTIVVKETGPEKNEDTKDKA
jgi:hypothetical protein